MMKASKMILLSPAVAAAVLSSSLAPKCNLLCRKSTSYRPLKVISMAEESRGNGDGVLEKVAIASGLISTPVIGWSLYTLKTTGCGLPPGPGGSIGALEGVSYLAIVGIVGWSLYTKSKTGSGLPNGPYGLLGAVEGLSYLALLGILVVFGFNSLSKDPFLVHFLEISALVELGSSIFICFSLFCYITLCEQQSNIHFLFISC